MVSQFWGKDMRPITNRPLYFIALGMLGAAIAIAMLVLTATQAKAASIYHYRALAVLALRKPPQPTPAPAPVPISEKCENCNGTGKLGDGTVGVDCPVCNGTGKRVAQSPPDQSILVEAGAAQTAGPAQDNGAGKPQRTLRSTIKGVLYSMDGCKPCERLKAEARKILPASNWTIGEAKDFAEACDGECDFYIVHQPSGTETFDRYPTFAVYRNGEMIRRYWGQMSAADLARYWLLVYESELTQ